MTGSSHAPHSPDGAKKTVTLWGERDLFPGLPPGADPEDDRAVLESFDASPVRRRTAEALGHTATEGDRRKEYVRTLFVESPAIDGGEQFGGVADRDSPHHVDNLNLTAPPFLASSASSAAGTINNVIFDARLHNQINNGLVRNRNFVSNSSQSNAVDTKLWLMRQNEFLQKMNLKLEDVSFLYDDVLNSLDRDMDLYCDRNRRYFDLRKAAFATTHGTTPIRLPDMTPAFTELKAKLKEYGMDYLQKIKEGDSAMLEPVGGEFFTSLEIGATQRQTTHGTATASGSLGGGNSKNFVDGVDPASTFSSQHNHKWNETGSSSTKFNVELNQISTGGGPQPADEVVPVDDYNGEDDLMDEEAAARGVLPFKGSLDSMFNTAALANQRRRIKHVGVPMEEGEKADRTRQIYEQNQRVFSYNVAHFLNKHGQAYRRRPQSAKTDEKIKAALHREKAESEDRQESHTRGRQCGRDWDVALTLKGHLGQSAGPLSQPGLKDVRNESPRNTLALPNDGSAYDAAMQRILDETLLAENFRPGSRGGSSVFAGEQNQSLAGPRGAPLTGGGVEQVVEKRLPFGTGVSQRAASQGPASNDPHPRRRTLLGPVTIWADNIDPFPCGSKKMAKVKTIDPMVKKLEYRTSRDNEFEHPMFEGLLEEVQKAKTANEEESDDFDVFDFMNKKKKVDPLEKIKNWKPRLPLESEIDFALPKVVDGHLINNALANSHQKTVPDPDQWEYDFRKMKNGFFTDRQGNPIIADVKNVLYHEKTSETLIMLNFLEDLLNRQKMQMLPFRGFDNLHIQKKNEELFKSQAQKTEAKKVKRQIVKACAFLSLRALRDVLHISEEEWNQARLPLRLISVKQEIMRFLSDEARDLDRAGFWKSIAETQKLVDHKRVTSFPPKHEKLPRMNLGWTPYKNWYARSMSPDRRRMEGVASARLRDKRAAQKAEAKAAGRPKKDGLDQLFNDFDKKVGQRTS